VIEAHLHTAPLSPQTPGDWDDLMIARLIAAGRQMTIQGEQSQWKLFDKIYDKAMDAARNARPGQAPQEFVAYFVLDVPRATLRLQEATNVTMNGSEANAPLAMATVSGRRFPILPGNDAGLRVIATIHTHAFQESSSGTTAPTHRVGPTAVRGLSKVDIDSARTEGLVKYAIDERSLHRVDPQGRKCQNRRRKLKGNVLRDALRVFGGEPLLRAEACG
jgi:hypothetical protein